METLADILSPAELARLDGLDLVARTAVEGFLSGRHRSVSRGTGGEFLQYREHTPGDDLRFVDWKLFARSDRLYQKVHQIETDMKVAILVDASASMDYGGITAPCTKFRYASMLAACFAYLARRQGDKAGIFAYSGKGLAGTQDGTLPLPQLLEILEGLQPEGTAHLEDALLRTEQYLGASRGLAVILSDFWGSEEALPKVIRRLRFARRDCIVCQVLDQDELQLPAQGTRRFVDAETGEAITTAPDAIRAEYQEKVRQHLKSLREACLGEQADYLLIITSQHFGEALASFLAHRNHTKA